MSQLVMGNNHLLQGAKFHLQIILSLSFHFSQFIDHPDYNANTFDNDFAIIKLASPVTFSERVSPICLPSTSTNYDNKVATVTGWGDFEPGGPQTDILQKVNVYHYVVMTCNVHIHSFLHL